MTLKDDKRRYIEILNECDIYGKKYELENLDIEQKLKEIEKFKVTVPLVGGFSSGKSTIINTMLEDKILAVSIVPETAIPTELEFGESEYIRAKIAGEWRDIDKETLKANDFNMKDTELIQARIKNEFLKGIEDVRLVDIPGLDSGIAEHSIAIDRYISKSMAYIVTVDAEQGFRNSVLEFLEELKFYDMPILVAITKGDKKSEEDLKKIREDIIDKVENKLGIKNYRVEITSSKDRNIEPVVSFLSEVQSRSEELFNRKYTKVLNGTIDRIESYLNTRIESKDFSIEEIEDKERDLEKQIQKVMEKLKKEEEKFSEQIDRTVEVIKGKISMELENSVDSIANDIMNNRNPKDKISSIIRKCIISGIKTELEPKLQRYFRNISDIMDSGIDMDGNIEVDELKVKMDGYLEDTIKKSIPAIMASIGFAISGPIGAVIVGALTIIVEGLFTKKRQDDKRKAAIEKVRSEIIPQVVREAERSVDETIMNYSEEISEQIEASVLREKEAKEKSLQDLRAQKQLKLEEQNILLEQLKAELMKVRVLHGRV